MSKRVIALIAVVAHSGCSFFMTRGPGDVGSPPAVDPDCTDSMGWPIADGAFAALFTLSVIGAMQDRDDYNQYGDSSSDADVIGPLIMIGAAAAAGSIVGYMRVDKCREARAAYAANYRPHYPPQPQPYYPPQQYPPQQYPPQQPQQYPPQQPQQYPPQQPQQYPPQQPQQYPPQQPQQYPPQQPQQYPPPPYPPQQPYPQQPAQPLPAQRVQ